MRSDLTVTGHIVVILRARAKCYCDSTIAREIPTPGLWGKAVGDRSCLRPHGPQYNFSPAITRMH